MTQLSSGKENISLVVTYPDDLKEGTESSNKKSEKIKYPFDQVKADELLIWLSDNIAIANYRQADMIIKGLDLKILNSEEYQKFLEIISQLDNKIQVDGVGIKSSDLAAWKSINKFNPYPSEKIPFNKMRFVYDMVATPVRLNKAKKRLLSYFHNKIGKAIIKKIIQGMALGVSQRDIADDLNGTAKYSKYNGKKFTFNQVNTLYNKTISFMNDFEVNNTFLSNKRECINRLSQGSSYLEISLVNSSIEERMLDTNDSSLIAKEISSKDKVYRKLPIDISIDESNIVISTDSIKDFNKELILWIYSVNGKEKYTRKICFEHKSHEKINIVKDAGLFPGGYICYIVEEDAIQYTKSSFKEMYRKKNMYLPMMKQFSIGNDIYDLSRIEGLGREFVWREIRQKGRFIWRPLRERQTKVAV